MLIDGLIRKEIVELHFLRESMIIGKDASSSDILRWDFSVMGAKSYVLNLSENVRRSLDFKLRNGEWSGKAPLGYLNARDANNKSILIPDPERSFLVRMLFEEYAMGTASISGDLVRRAKEWGLTNKTRKGGPLSPSQVQHILQNPFYYGVMRVKGQLHEHKYEALISKDLFDRCQLVPEGRSRTTATRYLMVNRATYISWLCRQSRANLSPPNFPIVTVNGQGILRELTRLRSKERETIVVRLGERPKKAVFTLVF